MPAMPIWMQEFLRDLLGPARGAPPPEVALVAARGDREHA